MTGGCQAHPLLISLANILMDFCMKATDHAFLLLVLLFIAKFTHKDQKTYSVSGESDDPWIFGLYPKASQKSSQSQYHDVRPGWLLLLCFHTSCSIHHWCAGGLSIVWDCRENITCHYGNLWEVWWPFLTWTSNGFDNTRMPPCHQRKC